jgi:hypothetical protein
VLRGLEPLNTSRQLSTSEYVRDVASLQPQVLPVGFHGRGVAVVVGCRCGNGGGSGSGRSWWWTEGGGRWSDVWLWQAAVSC